MTLEEKYLARRVFTSSVGWRQYPRTNYMIVCPKDVDEYARWFTENSAAKDPNTDRWKRRLLEGDLVSELDHPGVVLYSVRLVVHGTDAWKEMTNGSGGEV